MFKMKMNRKQLAKRVGEMSIPDMSNSPYEGQRELNCDWSGKTRRNQLCRGPVEALGLGKNNEEGIKRKKSRRAFGEYYTTAWGNRQACREEDKQGDGQPSGGREGRGLRRGGWLIASECGNESRNKHWRKTESLTIPLQNCGLNGRVWEPQDCWYQGEGGWEENWGRGHRAFILEVWQQRKDQR